MDCEFTDTRRYFKRVQFGTETDGEIKRNTENRVYANGFISVFDDEVTFPNGHRGKFLRLETPDRRDGAVVVAINANDEIAVVKQFRYAPRVWTLELPRGFVGPDDVGPFLTGWREFSEEVGGSLDVEECWSLGRVLPDSGKLHDAPYLMMARLRNSELDARNEAQNPDITEAISHKKGGRWIDYLELRRLIESGMILDMFSCAAFARLRPHFDTNGHFSPDLQLLGSERFKQSELDLRY